MKHETPPDADNPEPQTKGISIADYVDSVAELVARVSKKHGIPHGTAFNVVAWGVQHLEQQAEQARFAQSIQQFPQKGAKA